MYSDVVWSINIMCAILLVGVAISIYWIFMYDTWYPNSLINSNYSQSDDSGSENVGIGTN